MPNARRPWTIQEAGPNLLRASLEGPAFHTPPYPVGVEDHAHPRLARLRREYRLPAVLRGARSEFERLLRLRHWVHTRWPIDNAQNFQGDAFAILEHAKTGAGFHCHHAMVVQHAVLAACGFVVRDLGVDRDFRLLGRSSHHGVNEVWSNDFAKWVVFDAKYDIHFERRGVPLSAAELHAAARAGRVRGIVKVQGLRRRKTAMEDPRKREGSGLGYWWVSYHMRTDAFTHPHFSGGDKLLVWDNTYFRRSTWYRNNGTARVQHWAYAHKAFVRVCAQEGIDWTPCVPELAARQRAPHVLDVRLRSATPNFKTYRVRIDGGSWRICPGGRLRWNLSPGTHTLEVRVRNLFRHDGPPVTARVTCR